MKMLLGLLLVLGVVGCSHKAIYDNAQLNNRNKCITLPQSQYDACMESANKSYEEYENERKDMLDE